MTSISRATWPSRSPSSEAVSALVIIATGIDAVHVPRFSAMVTRRPRLIDRLFTPEESHRGAGELLSASSLAARFAAKEAVAKALGAPPGLAWHDCQVLSGEDGRPMLRIIGTVYAAATDAGIDRWHLSLTHDGAYAIAQVLAEGPDRRASQPMGEDRMS